MKKLFYVFLMASVAGFSQVSQPSENASKLPATMLKNTNRPSYNPLGKTQGTTATGWFNYYDALKTSGLGNFATSNYAPNLWPDSTVQIFYDDAGVTKSFYADQIATGEVIDPKGEAFADDPFNLSKYNMFSIDSFNFAYIYKRNNPNPAVVDTVIIQLYNRSALSTATLNAAPNAACAFPKYDAATNLGKSPVRTITRLLTISDTAVTFFRNFLMEINPPLSYGAVTGGEIFTATVAFRPGQSYSFGDTLSHPDTTVMKNLKNKMNQFRTYLWQEQLGYSQSTSATAAAERIYNNGLVLPTDVKYGLAGTSWNGNFIPGVAYTKPYIMDVDIHLTTNSQGLNIDQNGFGISEVYPNPSHGASEINVDVKLASAATVNVKVYNVLGKEMTSFSVNAESGSQTLKLDVSSYLPGVYFYTVSSGNSSVTKKFNVTK